MAVAGRSADASSVACSVVRAGECLVKTADSLTRLYSTEASVDPLYEAVRSRLLTAALLYKDFHLPLSSKLIQNLDGVMCLYETMNDQTFRQEISVLEGEMRRHAYYGQKMVDLHQWLQTDLLVLDKDAHKMISELERKVESHKQSAERSVQEGEEKAERKKNSGRLYATLATAVGVATDVCVFAGLPVLSMSLIGAGAVTASAVTSSHKFDRAKEVSEEAKRCSEAHQYKANLARSGVTAIQHELIPAITTFIEAVKEIAGFLQVLQSDASKFANDTQRMVQNPNTIALYRGTITRYSHDIRRACSDYLRVLPTVKASLCAIKSPSHQLHQNDIKQWLSIKAGSPENGVTISNYLLESLNSN